MATIVNIVVMARTGDWLYEHVVIAPEHAQKPALQWLSNILRSNTRPNVMTVVDRLCSITCSPAWGICDSTMTVADGRIYWHLMLRCDPPVDGDEGRIEAATSPL